MTTAKDATSKISAACEKWTRRCDDAKRIPDALFDIAPPIIQAAIDAATADLRAEADRLRAEVEGLKAEIQQLRDIETDEQRMYRIIGDPTQVVVMPVAPTHPHPGEKGE